MANKEQTDSEGILPRAEANFIRLEVQSLDRGKIEYDLTKDQIEIERLKTKLNASIQAIALRGTASVQILRYLWAFSAFCAAALTLDGFKVWGFTLDRLVLTALVGGTAASAFGLVSVVLAGLFRSPQPKKSAALKKAVKKAAKKAAKKVSK